MLKEKGKCNLYKLFFIIKSVSYTDVLKYLRGYLTLKYSKLLNVIYVNNVFKISM